MFLFGSGADTDAIDSLDSGNAFASTLILNKYSKQIKQIANMDAGTYRIIYSRNKKIYVQTIMNYYDKNTDTFSSKAINIFGNEKLKKIKNYFSGEKEDNDINDLCKHWYELLTEEKAANSEEEKKERDFFLENAILFGTLDEKFNSLRNNDLDLDNNAKRVIVAYWNVYLLIFTKLYRISADEELSYEKIFEILEKNSFEEEIKKKCYYKILKESNLEYNDDYFISTANYTSILGETFGDEKISWLHGRLNWFEDLKTLRVYDCTEGKDTILENIKNGHTVIPFILISSGVKPLICKKQIKQFSKFIDDLEKCNRLVTIGYRFNSEDNHINSIVGEWLSTNKNNQLISYSFNNNIDMKKLSWLPCHSKENLKEIDFNDNRILNDKQVTCVGINKDNSTEAFEKLIKELEERGNK